MVRGQSVFKEIERKYLYHYGKKETGIVLCGSMPKYSGSSATVWYDYSPSGNHGVITGAVWERLNSGLYVLSSDGTDDNVNCGSGASLDITTGIILEIWAKADSFSGDHFLMIKTGGLYTYTFGIYYRTVSTDFRIIWDDGTGSEESSGGSALSTDTWYHLVGVMDGTNKETYINGVQNTTQVATKTTIAADAGATVYIGAPGAIGWVGDFSLAQIYTYSAATLTSVLGHYAAERHLLGV